MKAEEASTLPHRNLKIQFYKFLQIWKRRRLYTNPFQKLSFFPKTLFKHGEGIWKPADFWFWCEGKTFWKRSSFRKRCSHDNPLIPLTEVSEKNKSEVAGDKFVACVDATLMVRQIYSLTDRSNTMGFYLICIRTTVVASQNGAQSNKIS